MRNHQDPEGEQKAGDEIMFSFRRLKDIKRRNDSSGEQVEEG